MKAETSFHSAKLANSPSSAVLLALRIFADGDLLLVLLALLVLLVLLCCACKLGLIEIAAAMAHSWTILWRPTEDFIDIGRAVILVLPSKALAELCPCRHQR